MKRLKLSSEEKAIEKALLKGEYFSLDKNDFKRISKAVAARRKDSVLNIRMNSDDIRHIKQKAAHLGIRYQTFVSEVLHQVAQA